MLEAEAGIKPAEVTEIQRQKGEYKEAVKALSEGRAVDGFDRLDKLGWVKELPEAEWYRQMAADYVNAVSAGKSAVVVSPTHAEAAKMTHEIREALRQAYDPDAEKKNPAAIRGDERTFRVLENANLTQAERGDAVNYRTGDVLQFHQNAKGFSRGDRLTVSSSAKLPVDQAKRFQVFHAKELKLAAGDMVRITHGGKTADEHRLDNGSLYRIRKLDEEGNIILTNGWMIGREFGHLAHGYVVTSHASQGRTVDEMFAGQSAKSFPATSREQAYVSWSRARDRVTVYTDDKEALRQAITRSDDRVTATEFVSGRSREVVALHQRAAPSIDRPKAREEIKREDPERS